MAVLTIRKYPDPVLLQKAAPVTLFDKELHRLIEDMFDTLYSAPGVGLAGPQVGHSLSLFVYDVKESDESPRHKGVLINPEMISRSGRQNDEEGCLSVEDFRTWVARDNRIVISGLDQDQKKVTLEGEGLLARLFQHEMDHLEGKLFINRISSLKRNLYLKRIKKRQKAEQDE